MTVGDGASAFGLLFIKNSFPAIPRLPKDNREVQAFSVQKISRLH